MSEDCFDSKFSDETRNIFIAALGFLVSLAWRDVIIKLLNLNDWTSDLGFIAQVCIFLIYAVLVTLMALGVSLCWVSQPTSLIHHDNSDIPNLDSVNYNYRSIIQGTENKHRSELENLKAEWLVKKHEAENLLKKIEAQLEN